MCIIEGEKYRGLYEREGMKKQVCVCVWIKSWVCVVPGCWSFANFSPFFSIRSFMHIPLLSPPTPLFFLVSSAVCVFFSSNFISLLDSGFHFEHFSIRKIQLSLCFFFFFLLYTPSRRIFVVLELTKLESSL